MFSHCGNIVDLCNSLFLMGLRNTETRYLVLCELWTILNMLRLS